MVWKNDSGGEDPKFIVRRLIILASEDIGMSDPNAMVIAHAAWNALQTVGMPEARIPIAQAIIYLSKAKKSNAVHMLQWIKLLKMLEISS